MTFLSREEAGRRLGHYLADRGVHVDMVLGLPRGGVVVAAEVAQVLGCPLDVLVVRKLGHPRHREFAVGALAEPGVVLLDHNAMKQTRVDPVELEEITAEERERLLSYRERFHPGGPPELAHKRVLIVDDGLATGATAEAAVVSAREQRVAHVAVAAPVASTGAVQRLNRIADEVLVMVVDPDFMAVGQYYDSFPQTSDREVLELLPAHA